MPRKPKAIAAPIEKPTVVDFFHSTVRQTDEGDWYGSAMKTAELVARYGGDVKVAASRNGAGVASVPLRVYRRTQGVKSAWAGKRLNVYERNRLKQDAGLHATKAAEFADDVEEVTDPNHPLVWLLTNFNERDDGFNAIEKTEIALGLTGDGYWLKTWGENGMGERVTDYPTSLFPLAPHKVRVIPDRDRRIGGYKYGTGFDVEVVFDPSAMIHFSRPSISNEFYGYGDLQACLIQADVSLDIAQFWKAALDNACQPGLVISGDGVTANTRDELAEAFERRYKGVKKAAITAVLSGDLKIDKWALDKTDFSHLEGETAVRGMIARAFDMPIELLEMRPGGLSDGKGVGIHQWQQYGLKPRCKRMENRINSNLVPDFYSLDPTLFVAFDNAVDEDEEALERRAVALFSANLYDRNRALSLLGEDAVDDGPVYAIDLTTQATIAAQPPAPEAPQGAVEPATAPPNPEDAEKVKGIMDDVVAGLTPPEVADTIVRIFYPSIPDADRATMIAAATDQRAEKQAEAQAKAEQDLALQREKLTQPGTPPPGAPASGDPGESGPGSGPPGKSVAAAGAASSKAMVGPKEAFEEALKSYFAAWAPHVLGLIDPTDTVRSYLNGDAEAFDQLLAVMNTHTEPPMMSGNNEAAGKVIARFGGESDISVWNVPPQDAIDFLKDRNGKAAGEILKNYDETVRVKVSDAIAEALTETRVDATGETVGAVTSASIQAKVAQALPEVHQQKAALIASTETQRAFTEGARNAYDKSEHVKGYEWVLSGNPCPVCVELSKQTTAKGEAFLNVGDTVSLPDGGTFENTYGPVNGPPVHPGCLCQLEPIFK